MDQIASVRLVMIRWKDTPVSPSLVYDWFAVADRNLSNRHWHVEFCLLSISPC